MISFKIVGKEEMELLMSTRLEMLRIVNGKPEDYQFSTELQEESRAFYEQGSYREVVAMDGGTAVGWATLCFLRMMPTFDHPTGRRAHLMNVYTKKEYRRQGIARTMVQMLIDEARSWGATEISLDATDMGRPLYESLGFRASDEAMTLCLRPSET